MLYLRKVLLLLLLAPLFWGTSVQAEIVIVGPGRQYIPLALPASLPLDSTASPAVGAGFDEALRDDLLLTGIFGLADPRAFLSDAARPGLTSPEVDFGQWRTLGVDILVKSGYSVQGGELRFEARLFDVTQSTLLVGRRYRGRPGDERQMAHAFADQILKALTGKEGPFSGKIAFVAKVDGNKELYLIDSDGRGLTPLTAHRSIALNPDFSPVAKELVFTSYRSGRPELYRKEIYSGEEVRISNRKGVNIGGRYSPDGTTVAASLSFSGNAELYLLGTDGTIRRRLTENGGIDVDPAWNPDGTQLAFTSDRYGAPQVFILQLDSAEPPRRLTATGKYDTSPAWSPDGARIAFARLEEGVFQIYSIRPDGSDERRLTSGPGNKEHPRWSPDGRFLVFAAETKEGRGIHVMRADGEGLRRLTPPGLASSQPAWSGRW